MDIDNILEKLKTGNEHLDQLAKKYFVHNSKLDQPIIGNYSFNDVKSDFDFWLTEYSLNHSKVFSLGKVKTPPSEELLKMNNIHINTYHAFARKVNKVLKSYTDEDWSIESKRNVLEKQIKEFANGYCREEKEDVKYRMFQALSVAENNLSKRNNYLDGVISAMQKAELNQMEDNEYMVLVPLFEKYNEFSKYMEDFNFREKKKYLKKLQNSKSDSAISALVKYTNQLLEDNNQDIKIIQWFFFYLIYGKHEVDIFMIHTMQGYKYASAGKFYQNLFCKDHSTGRKDDFLHHTNVFSLQKKHLEDEVFHIYETILHYL